MESDYADVAEVADGQVEDYGKRDVFLQVSKPQKCQQKDSDQHETHSTGKLEEETQIEMGPHRNFSIPA